MKRFTATEKWMTQWFQELSPAMKCFWIYLCDNCDAAGVWDSNFRMASFVIGSEIARDSLAAFGGRVVELRPGKFWIEAFISFQYGKLSRACLPHLRVLNLLEKHGIEYRGDACFIRHSTPKAIATLPDRVTATLEEEDKDKEEEGVEGENKSPESERTPFSQFWAAYPKKVAKGFAEKAWRKGKCANLLPQILEAIGRAKVAEAWTKECGQFIPHPATWLNGRCWEDELSSPITRSDGAARGGNPKADPPAWAGFLESIQCPGKYKFDTAPSFLHTDFRNWKTAHNL